MENAVQVHIHLVNCNSNRRGVEVLEDISTAAVRYNSTAQEWRHRQAVFGGESVAKLPRPRWRGSYFERRVTALERRSKELATDELEMVVDGGSHYFVV